MRYSQFTSPERRLPQLSSSRKKEILWNIIEPGDTYDIKKSMIAKMPGQKHNFMGEHIQLVCLMQAAEIERLCQYLEEYKQKDWQLKRQKLDRHGYEIIIKELTQKLTEEGGNKAEIEKYKDYLKKQNEELDKYRQNISDEDGISKKYEDALSQIKMLMQENRSLKAQNDKLRDELERTSHKIADLQIQKQHQLDDLRYQMNIAHEHEIQELGFKYQGQINKLEYESKRMKQINDTKNREIEQLQNQTKLLKGQMEEMRRKLEYYGNLQNKFGELSQEIERLNMVLRNKSNECEELVRKHQQQEDKNNEIPYLKKEIQNYKLKIDGLEREITNNWKSKVSMLEQRNGNIQRENEELRKKVQEQSQHYYKVMEYESEINYLNQQIERLTQNLKNGDKQNEEYRRRLSEAGEVSRRCNELQNKLKSAGLENDNLRKNLNELNQESQKKYMNYQSRIQQLVSDVESGNEKTNRKNKQYQNMVMKLGQELEKMKQNAVNKVQEFNEMQKNYMQICQEFKNLKIQLTESEENAEIKMQDYEGKINIWDKKLKQAEAEKQDCEKRLAMINEKYQKLENAHQRKDEQSNNLEQKLSNLQSENVELKHHLEELQYIIEQNNNKIKGYEQKIHEYDGQLYGLQNKIGDLEMSKKKMENYENNIGRLEEQVEKLRKTIREKDSEKLMNERKFGDNQRQLNGYKNKYLQLETKLKQISKENQDIRTRIVSLSEENKLLPELKNKVQQLNQEVERARTRLQGREDELRGSKKENDRLRKSSGEMSQQINEMERTNQYLTNEIDQLKKTLDEKENTIHELHDKLQWMDGVLKEKDQQIGYLTNQLKQLQEQYNNLKESFRSPSPAKSVEEASPEQQSMVKQYNEENTKLKNDLRETCEKVEDYESRIRLLNREIQKGEKERQLIKDQNLQLENKIMAMEHENDSLKKSGSSSKMSMMQATQQFTNKIRTYEMKITQIGQQNDEYKRNINELNRNNEQLKNKMMGLKKQLERGNDTLRNVTDENNNMKESIRSLQVEISGYQKQQSESDIRGMQQMKMQVEQYENRVRQYMKQNEDLRNKLQEEREKKKLDVDSRIEGKMTTLSQQVDRLNIVLAEKVQENERLKKNSRENEYKLSKMSQEYELKMRKYQSSFHEKNKELEGVYHQLKDYQDKLNKYSKENERLNNLVKGNENVGINNQLRLVQQEVDNLKKVNKELEYGLNQKQLENQELIRNLQNKQPLVQEYQSKIYYLEQQMEKLTMVDQQKGEQIMILEKKIRGLELQIENLKRNQNNQQYEKKMFQLTSEVDRLNDVLKMVGSQFEQKHQLLEKYKAELERLNNSLRLKVEQSIRYDEINRELVSRLKMLQQKNGQMSNEYKMVCNQYQNAKRNLAKYDESIKKLYAEFERLQSIMQELKKDNYNLKKELKDSENLIEKNRMLSLQIDRLNEVIEGQKNEIGELRIRFADETALHLRINEHMALMVVLFAEIESLRQRVKDKEKQVEDVRRSSLAPYKI